MAGEKAWASISPTLQTFSASGLWRRTQEMVLCHVSVHFLVFPLPPGLELNALAINQRPLQVVPEQHSTDWPTDGQGESQVKPRDSFI